MKKSTFSLLLLSVVLASCGSKQLSREEAFRIIRQQEQYPQTLDMDIYCADPQFARKALDAGLESQGLLTIQRTQKLIDIGKPLIHFTAKAQPYFLSTPAADQSMAIQRVKIADADIIQVTGIQRGSDGQSAVVEYTTVYKNVTPFAALSNGTIQGKKTRTVYLSLYDDGWRIVKR